jgi:hypothetical protein
MIDITQKMIDLFWDATNGGLYEVAEGSNSLIVRLKDIEERERPSTNSIALELFTRLWLITSDSLWKKRASVLIQTFSKKLNAAPHDFPWFLQGIAWHFKKTKKIVLAGKLNQSQTQAFIATLQEMYRPNSTFLFHDETSPAHNLCWLSPSFSDMKLVDGNATVYVCDDSACYPPILTLKNLHACLEKDK